MIKPVEPNIPVVIQDPLQAFLQQAEANDPHMADEPKEFEPLSSEDKKVIFDHFQNKA